MLNYKLELFILFNTYYGDWGNTSSDGHIFP